jgi:DNA polymerase-3 subunit delta'
MLIGFNQTKSALFNSHQTQKLHHAILLHGKKGIGKASFAAELAKEILGKSALYPDLLLIEKEAEKKEITVDKIRKIADFSNQTSAISADKFILIDSACELNKSASNALLKILEEPIAIAK